MVGQLLITLSDGTKIGVEEVHVKRIKAFTDYALKEYTDASVYIVSVNWKKYT